MKVIGLMVIALAGIFIIYYINVCLPEDIKTVKRFLAGDNNGK